MCSGDSVPRPMCAPPGGAFGQPQRGGGLHVTCCGDFGPFPRRIAHYISHMPYRWTATQNGAGMQETLTLWPHRSLPRAGFAAAVLGCFLFITLPFFGLLGTRLLWGLLPFLLIAVGALWWGLEASYRSANIREDLVLERKAVRLKRVDPDGRTRHWECNPYWVRTTLHKEAGPVPNYVTLSGNGREVEIGAFLSEDERKTLFDDLTDRLNMNRNR